MDLADPYTAARFLWLVSPKIFICFIVLRECEHTTICWLTLHRVWLSQIHERNNLIHILVPLGLPEQKAGGSTESSLIPNLLRAGVTNSQG